MSVGTIVLVSDRSDRSRGLATAISAVAECVIADLRTVWSRMVDVRAVIADISLANAEAKRCLLSLHASFRTVGCPPVVLLTRWNTASEQREALAHGVTACVSVKETPRAIVAQVMELACPGTSLADLVVTREIGKASSALNLMFAGARASGRADRDEIEAGIDPVLRATREGGLGRWLEMVWKHDDATFQHSLLVAGLTATFAQRLGFSEADQRLVTRGALVHDIGKAKVPLAVLNKPGELDAYEQLVMRAHPVLGHDVLKASGETDPVVLGMTRHHHELLDGTGYPDGLSGRAIADPIRILTICDIYAALVERRPYKAALPSSSALDVLQTLSGKLEGVLVDAFTRTIHQGA